MDPNNEIPEVITVAGNRAISISIPRNKNANGVEHGQGYVIYGVSGPQGLLRLTDSAGADISHILAGATPSMTNFGTARLADIPVISEDSFNVRLETDAVTLDGIRDRHADGDLALLQLNDGIDVNANPGVDHVTPNSVKYGFEEFTDVNQPGFFDPSGEGIYQQSIDASSLPEGMHYLNVRAFRHRDPNTITGNDPTTAGDGGPAVFSEFREAVYIDRLPPEAEIASFEPYSELQLQRDLIGRSSDGTADSMHIFLNMPGARTEAEILAMAAAGQGAAEQIDDDLFVYGFNLVPSGNNVVTLVTFEITGNYNIQRLPGQFLITERGLGIGDLSFDGQLSPIDMAGITGSFEDVLYSQNTKFNPAADTNADGFVDTRDLLMLRDFVVPAGADQETLDALRGVVVRRGDLDNSGTTDADDIDRLLANYGPATDWLLDLNVDGLVDMSDLTIMVEEIVGTLMGDANLDGVVDGLDFVVWNDNKFTSGTGWASGDFNGDGITDGVDFTIWNSFKFQSGSGGNPYNYNPSVVPEPSVSIVGMLFGLALFRRRRR